MPGKSSKACRSANTAADKGSAAAFKGFVNWKWLFCERVSQKVANAITGGNNSIAIGVF